MRAARRLPPLALLLALAACKASPPGGFGVNLTITADGVAGRGQIAKARVVVSGAEPFDTVIDGSALRGGELHVQYIPGVQAGTLAFRVEARDGGGAVLASGASGDVALLAGHAVAATVALGGAPGDGGSGGDMGGGPVCAHVTVMTLAGNGIVGFVNGTGGASGTARFANPRALAVDTAGDIFVADNFNYSIRQVSAVSGDTTTLAGNGMQGFADGADGPTSQFQGLQGLATQGAGFVFVGDGQRLRGTSGATMTLIQPGSGLGGIWGIVYDHPDDVLFVADRDNNQIKKIVGEKTISVLAGTTQAGFTDSNAGNLASFFQPNALAFDGQSLYVSDSKNHSIRVVGLQGGATTTLAGNGSEGFVDGTGTASGSARFSDPQGVAVDRSGYVYVTDSNHAIRRVAPNGDTLTIAGGLKYSQVHDMMVASGFRDGNGCDALFADPTGIVLLDDKTLVVADSGNNRLRKIFLP